MHCYPLMLFFLLLYPRALHFIFCFCGNTFSPFCSQKDPPRSFHQAALRSWGTPAAPAVPEEAAAQGLVFLISFCFGTRYQIETYYKAENRLLWSTEMALGKVLTEQEALS